MNSAATFTSATVGYLTVSAQGGTDGGEIKLAKPLQGSTLASDVVIDVSINSLRIFENGGAFRGVSVDLTGTGSQSNLWHSGNFDPTAKANISGQTFSGPIAARNNANTGYVQLQSGDANYSGFVEFRNAAGTRHGYIGFGQGTEIAVAAEVGFYNFVGPAPRISGQTIWNAGNFDPATKLTVASRYSMRLVAQGVTTIANRVEGGMYQQSDANTATGWPEDGNKWQHLIASTHSNEGNYYSLQISSPFDGNSNFYMRSTGNSGTTPWRRLWHNGNFDPASKLDAAGGAINTGTLGFGSTTRQMINLWNTSYGIGVQDSTAYIRTGNEFAVHQGGAHVAAQGDSGGGTTLLRVASTYFQYKGNTVWNAGNFDPNGKANVSGQVFTGDITTVRANGNTGVIYLGNQSTNGNRYLFYDGANYVMPGADLYVNGAIVARNGAAPRFTGVSLGTGQSYIYSDTNSHNVVIRGGDGSTNNPYRYIVVYPDIVRTINSGFYADGDIRTGGRLIAGEGQTNSYIEMRDTDEGTRYVHNNSGTIGFLGSDGAWKLRVYDNGQIWSPAFGDITTYVGGRVAKTGDTMTGDITVSKANPGYNFFYSGVYSSKMWVGNDAIFRYSHNEGDGDQFRISPGGALWCKQLGDINTRIEDRAFAWAADRASFRVAKTGDTMTGELIINKGDGQLRLADPGNNGQWRINAFGDGRIYFQDFFQGSFQGNRFYVTRNGEMWTSQMGDIATYINNVVNNKDVRLAYAGDLNHTWNAGGGYEEPYGGGVMTSRQTSGSPYNILGFRWRYLQMSNSYAQWYTVGYV